MLIVNAAQELPERITVQQARLGIAPESITEQYDMVPYTSLYKAKFEGYKDMNEMALQFGYIAMFSVAFPACATLGFLNNVIEIRADANKLVRVGISLAAQPTL